jgi:hypothetical protein
MKRVSNLIGVSIVLAPQLRGENMNRYVVYEKQVEYYNMLNGIKLMNNTINALNNFEKERMLLHLSVEIHKAENAVRALKSVYEDIKLIKEQE